MLGLDARWLRRRRILEARPGFALHLLILPIAFVGLVAAAVVQLI